MLQMQDMVPFVYRTFGPLLIHSSPYYSIILFICGTCLGFNDRAQYTPVGLLTRNTETLQYLVQEYLSDWRKFDKLNRKINNVLHRLSLTFDRSCIDMPSFEEENQLDMVSNFWFCLTHSDFQEGGDPAIRTWHNTAEPTNFKYGPRSLRNKFLWRK